MSTTEPGQRKPVLIPGGAFASKFRWVGGDAVRRADFQPDPSHRVADWGFAAFMDPVGVISAFTGWFIPDGKRFFTIVWKTTDHL